jgi:hypothetical protein
MPELLKTCSDGSITEFLGKRTLYLSKIEFTIQFHDYSHNHTTLIIQPLNLKRNSAPPAAVPLQP